MPKLSENNQNLLVDFNPQEENLLSDFQPEGFTGATYGLKAAEPNYLNEMMDIHKESGVNEDTIRSLYPEITAERQWQKEKNIDGKITMRETIERMDGMDWIGRTPFIGPMSNAAQMSRLMIAVERLKKDAYEEGTVPAGVVGTSQATMPVDMGPEFDYPLGFTGIWTPESARQADVRMVEDYLLEQQELRDRGQSFGSKVFEGVSYLPGWMIEFFMTGGIAKMGNEAAKNIAVKTMQGYAKTVAGRTILRGAGWTGSVITRGSLGLVPRTFENAITKKVPKQMRFGPNDKLIIDIEGDDWATAVMNGYLNTIIEAGTEEMGGAITKAGGGLLKRLPFANKVLPPLQKAWQRLHPEAGATEFWNQIFSRAGYQGLIGEIGEEHIATILRAVLKTETFGLPDDSGPWERLQAGLSSDFALDNFGAEVITLMVPGVTRFAGGQIAAHFSPQEIRIANGYQKQMQAVDQENLTPRQKVLKKAAIAHRMQYELDSLQERTEKETEEFAREADEIAPKEETIEEPTKAIPAPAQAEPAENVPVTDNEYHQSLLDAGAMDAHNVLSEFVGENQEIDLEDVTTNDADIGFIKNVLRDFGFREEGDYEPLNDKDYWNIFKYIQMPDDVRKSFPQFDPVYQVQRARENQKAVLDRHFAEALNPYFQLNKQDRKAVDAALFEADRNPEETFEPKTLTNMGLSQDQINAFLSVRLQLDTAANMLVAKMEELGVKPDVIDDFKKRNRNYIPHKWYGNWAIVAREKDETGKYVTVFMSSVNRLGRSKEHDRVKKLFPNADVKVIKRKNIPYEDFQSAPPFAVQQMIELAMKKAEVDDSTKQIMHQALSDLYKSKGFGMHFIPRKNIPGYTEDLQRPIAEYFSGFSGYITKMEAVKSFPDAVKNIDPRRTPNLSRYTTDYINYVLGQQTEFGKAKQAMYFWYLYGNLKSATLNLTQQYVLGWPVLSKHTNLALPKLLIAQTRTMAGQLTDKEKAFLNDMEEAGHLDPKLAQEISGFSRNPLYHPIFGKAKKAMTYGDIFRHMESFNRRSMAVACYNAGITDIDKVAELIEEAHFRYGKGNRPTLARGPISPVMTFRSWGINYLTWLKNEIKAGHIVPELKSALAITLFGGLKALPLFGGIVYAWRKVFDEDIEAEARSALGPFWGKALMRGAPSVIPPGISMTGSIGIDMPTAFTTKEIGGVFADIPDRGKRVAQDIKTKQYLRALEDAAPEALRNPLGAYRMYKQGVRNRSGRPVIDYETKEPMKPTVGETIAKGLGYASSRSAEQWDMRRFLEQTEKERQELKSNWADRIVLSRIMNDPEMKKEVMLEINKYNAAMEHKNRNFLKIPLSELEQLIAYRLKPLGIPSTSIMDLYEDSRTKYYGK